MKIRTIFIALAAATFSFTTLSAQDMPEMPKPQKEHEWLAKFVGEWETTSEVYLPDQEPAKGKGTETVKALGPFWVVSQGKGEVMGMTMSFAMTLGYDATKKKYVGTMIDSMTNIMWKYEGTLDATGNILTLETQGPCPMRGGVMTDFQDITEFKSDGTRSFTSRFKDEKGEWITVFKGEAKKKS